MPHDLFGDVLVRPPSIRSRRSSVVVLSVGAHGVLVLALFVVPLLAADTLPIPQRAIDFIIGSTIIPVIPDPPRMRSAPRGASTDLKTEALATVPIDAPEGIHPEPMEPAGGGGDAAGPPAIGTIVGVEQVAPPPAMAPVRVYSGIHAPQKVVDVMPTYPAAARAARIQGMVIVEATIDAHGNVVAARILKSRPFLDDAALEAVRQWKYSPVLLNGVPVPVIMTVTVNFQLGT
jgi:periplasmic protein TonB